MNQYVIPGIKQKDLPKVDAFTPDHSILTLVPGNNESVNLTMRGITAAHMAVLGGIVDLVGPTNTLASVKTLKDQAGRMICFVLYGNLYIYRLQIGNPSPILPDVVFPNDRGPAPNNRYWALQIRLGGPIGGRWLSPTPPPNPFPGLEWINTTTMREFTYYGTAWVETASAVSGGGGTVSEDDIMSLIGNGEVIDYDNLPPPLVGNLPVVNEAATAVALTGIHLNKSMRLTNVNDRQVILYSESDNFVANQGCRVQVVNASDTGTVTFVTQGNTLNAPAGFAGIPPRGHVTLHRVAINTWDLLS